jgi:hypothetical protein
MQREEFRMREGLRQIPLESMNSGAVQFEDDWPGLYLSGKDCLRLINELRFVREQVLDAPRAAILVGCLNDIEEAIERDVRVRK